MCVFVCNMCVPNVFVPHVCVYDYVPYVCGCPRRMEKDSLDLSYMCMSITQCGSWKPNLGPLAEQQVNAKLSLLLTKHVLVNSLYFNCECPPNTSQHKHRYSYF